MSFDLEYARRMRGEIATSPTPLSGINYRGKAIEDFTREEMIAYIVMNKAKPFLIREEALSLPDLVKTAAMVNETGRLAPTVPWKAQGAA